MTARSDECRHGEGDPDGGPRGRAPFPGRLRGVRVGACTERNAERRSEAA